VTKRRDDEPEEPRLPRVVLPPDLLETLERVRVQLDAVRLPALAVVGRVSAAVSQSAAQSIQDPLGRFGPELARLLEAFEATWEAALPANWAGMGHPEIYAILDCMEATGICLVWVPRVTIVQEVVTADPDDALALMLASQDDVLIDICDALSLASQPNLLAERQGLLEVVECLRAGRTLAAQALAASVLTSTLHVFLEERKLFAIRERVAETHPNDAEVEELRLRAIFVAVTKALAWFDPEAQNTITAYNRHNTAHRLGGAGQWTPGNALSAAVLAACLLREMEEWVLGGGSSPSPDPE
jgi:hypothetical protein